MPRPRLLNLANPPKRRQPSAQLRESLGETLRIVNAGPGGTAEIFVYDEIGYFGVTASDFVDAIRTLGAQPVNLHINSPGGDVWDGMAIYNAIQQHPAEVTVYVDGIAASAASFIAMAGDRLVMAKSSNLMIHDALCLTFGNEEDHHVGADLLGKISGQIAGIYADKSGTDEGTWRAAMRTETWYTGAEAVAAGLADEVADAQRQGPQMSNTAYPSIFAFAGRDNAPAPTLPAPAPAAVPDAPPPAPALVWDSAAAEAFRSAMREAVV